MSKVIFWFGSKRGAAAALLILSLTALFVKVVYALTLDEIGQHTIRMINRGLTQDIATPEEERVFFQIMGKYGREWILNGNFGTQADRRSACQEIGRGIFIANTGKSTTTAQGFHDYRHWLVEAVGLSTGAASAIEP